MPSIHLSGVLRQLPKVRLVHQRSTSKLVKGRTKWGAYKDVDKFAAVVQPADAATIQSLDGGEHVSEAILIHTRHKIDLADEAQGDVTDRVLYDCRQFRVFEDGNWSQHGFRRYVGTRVKKR